jgi:hypothetical protein
VSFNSSGVYNRHQGRGDTSPTNDCLNACGRTSEKSLETCDNPGSMSHAWLGVERLLAIWMRVCRNMEQVSNPVIKVEGRCRVND